jgi:hypothetical protein
MRRAMGGSIKFDGEKYFPALNPIKKIINESALAVYCF